ncbi:hypothetical protein WOLCODRAFT_148344 [Wolfiporia cocos MD-104 SS10]|uniref:TPX2 C-terminal domain-containing protein n=1 Tax=Wolfiporia cocos (strain MD-104) TaxID=742152 RepID=A0A2H3IWB8_WOLCO|nr:hypothetical protein WOLCODRAFT_148344 [Wolfiporia cocos MD-104 SS10]
MADLSLRHIPDLSDASMAPDYSDTSFQIPPSAAGPSADRLLDEDSADFLRAAGSALNTPAPNARTPRPRRAAGPTPRSAKPAPTPVRFSARLRARQSIATPLHGAAAVSEETSFEIPAAAAADGGGLLDDGSPMIGGGDFTFSNTPAVPPRAGPRWQTARRTEQEISFQIPAADRDRLLADGSPIVDSGDYTFSNTPAVAQPWKGAGDKGPEFSFQIPAAATADRNRLLDDASPIAGSGNFTLISHTPAPMAGQHWKPARGQVPEASFQIPAADGARLLDDSPMPAAPGVDVTFSKTPAHTQQTTEQHSKAASGKGPESSLQIPAADGARLLADSPMPAASGASFTFSKTPAYAHTTGRAGQEASFQIPAAATPDRDRLLDEISHVADGGNFTFSHTPAPPSAGEPAATAPLQLPFAPRHPAGPSRTAVATAAPQKASSTKEPSAAAEEEPPRAVSARHAPEGEDTGIDPMASAPRTGPAVRSRAASRATRPLRLSSARRHTSEPPAAAASTPTAGSAAPPPESAYERASRLLSTLLSPRALPAITEDAVLEPAPPALSSPSVTEAATREASRLKSAVRRPAVTELLPSSSTEGAKVPQSEFDSGGHFLDSRPTSHFADRLEAGAVAARAGDAPVPRPTARRAAAAARAAEEVDEAASAPPRRTRAGAIGGDALRPKALRAGASRVLAGVATRTMSPPVPPKAGRYSPRTRRGGSDRAQRTDALADVLATYGARLADGPDDQGTAAARPAQASVSPTADVDRDADRDASATLPQVTAPTRDAPDGHASAAAVHPREDPPVRLPAKRPASPVPPPRKRTRLAAAQEARTDDATHARRPSADRLAKRRAAAAAAAASGPGARSPGGVLQDGGAAGTGTRGEFGRARRRSRPGHARKENRPEERGGRAAGRAEGHMPARPGQIAVLDKPAGAHPPAKTTRPIAFHFYSDARAEARRAAGSGEAPPPPHASLAIPDFKALHAAHESALAARRAQVAPVVPMEVEFATDVRARERERFEEGRRARERELEAQMEERRRQRALEEEEEVRELRRRAVPRAHEVPEWYAHAPKRTGKAKRED